MLKQLAAGLDYRLYNIYAWGGLGLIVVYILVSTLVFDVLTLPGPQVFPLLAGPMLLWFVGILLYWWWVFLFKGNRELRVEPDAGAGSSRHQVFEELEHLAPSPGDQRREYRRAREECQKGEPANNRVVW